MDFTVKNKSKTQPKTMAELLPEICSAILSEDAVQTLMSQKRSTVAHSRTAEKAVKPMTIAEMKTAMLRKTNVKISGIYNMPRTPVISNNFNKNDHTMLQRVNNLKNKENNFNIVNVNKKIAVPEPYNHRKLISLKPETPIFNMSFKSNSDASFLQKEKEINDIEEKTKALTDKSTLESIAEISPPVSTPFKQYRNVKDFFNNIADSDISAVYNDTVTCFEKKICEQNEYKREESVIVSLCDMFNKATVNSSDKISTELDDLLEVEKQTKKNIKMIENGIKTLNHIKESQLKSLQSVRKLINEKKIQKVSENEKNTTLVPIKTECKSEPSSINSPMLNRPSVIKMKLPSYKIPKKNLCLRKNVL